MYSSSSPVMTCTAVPLDSPASDEHLYTPVSLGPASSTTKEDVTATVEEDVESEKDRLQQ